MNDPKHVTTRHAKTARGREPQPWRREVGAPDQPALAIAGNWCWCTARPTGSVVLVVELHDCLM
ncbi:hypothetical protein E2C01_012747 [Portunus trituberculatus]|uniref:Uncharacterized protein n=1 Tax=Portunus trituberculatus TaxID=210409 RepID=A0A5B7DEU7_PORTR|nr:hypothetical protein [Portunus trituberculatus]